MAVSGSSSFTATRDQVLNQAARLVNAMGIGTTMSADMLQQFAFMLNAMVKSWHATGLHVWTTTEATLFPVAAQVKYTLGTGSTDHVTQTYYETAITTLEAAAQTVLSVDLTTNMTALDKIGIVLDTGAVHWTTIVSKTSTTVTVTDALVGSAAAGNAVYNYTSDIVRPLKVTDARRYNRASHTETPVRVVSRQEYQNLPMKTGTGQVTQLFYDAQLTNGYVYLWQVPSTLTDLIKFTWHRPIMDFNAAADNPDLPQEWILTLVYNLAELMIPQYPVSPQKFKMITSKAAELLDMMKGFDREAESIFVQPERF